MIDKEKEMEDAALIEAYLEHRLTDSEVKGVEKRLHEDADFAALFKDLSLLITSMNADSRKDLRARLREVEETFFREGKTRSMVSTWWPYGIAAAIILGVGVFWFVNQSNVTPEQLYAANFEPYPNIVQPLVRGGEDERAKAFELYDAGSYDKAIEAFRKSGETDDATKLYIANALLASGRADEAVEYLSSITSPAFKSSSQWYLALAYLKKGDVDNGKRILEMLAGNANPYQERARSMVKQL